jgi:hypothetical protein
MMVGGTGASLNSSSPESNAVSTINFKAAYYIKLGRGGVWEADSIASGKLRLGWKECSVEDINGGKWTVIERQLRAEMQGKPPGVATSDLNALKRIVASGPEDIWITFHQNKLWWTRLASGPVKEDKTSKYRLTSQQWSDLDAAGRLLAINDLPGKLTQLQGFRATACRVNHIDLLRRTLNGTRSPLAMAIRAHREILSQHLAEAIKELHWKDFETLVDLVFRAAGWVRVSVLGQHAKGYDIELREPIIGDRYVVQVKSRAGLADLEATIENFSPNDFRRVFFVVHSPQNDLPAPVNLPKHVEIISPQCLATLAMDAGLSGWIEQKVT